MKKYLLLGSLALVAACSKVPAGNVGVKVDLYGSSKGVSAQVLTPGRYWIGWNEELFIFPTFTQNYTWSSSPNESSAIDESISFQTSDGMVVSTDLGIAYHIEEDKVVDVFQKYRQGIDEITNIALHNMVRNALVTEGSTKPIETVYGSGKADLLKAVLADVQAQARPIGIIVEQLNWVGKLKLPPNVEAAINQKIAATQQAEQHQNEVAIATADANKAVATATGEANSVLVRAKAEAQANDLIAKSITPTLVQWEALKRWNGAVPYVNGGGAMPFINLQPPVTK